MNLNEYINKKYKDNPNDWFVSERNKAENLKRITDTINNRNYLAGSHKILSKANFKWKNVEFVTRKTRFDIAQSILQFHISYLIGKPISLTGSEDIVKAMQKVYRDSNYNKVDYEIVSKAISYGNCFEYVFWDSDNKKIKSKIINSDCGFPIYQDSEMIAFIENYKDSDNVEYYNVYTATTVEKWNNADGNFEKADELINITGLPIHYRNTCLYFDDFGVSDIDKMISILNEYEDVMGKLGDAIYTNSLNPLLAVLGQKLPDNALINADLAGQAINLEDGDCKYVDVMMDYNTIKLYLDNLKQELMDIMSIPSTVMGQTNISNVSETSLKMAYQKSSDKGYSNSIWFKDGLYKRFEAFRKILEKQGITFNEDSYIDVEANFNRPQNDSDILDNMVKQFGMGALSIESIVEKSPLTIDKTVEMERISKEKADTTGDSENSLNQND